MTKDTTRAMTKDITTTPSQIPASAHHTARWENGQKAHEQVKEKNMVLETSTSKEAETRSGDKTESSVQP